MVSDSAARRGPAFREVADRVWVARHEWFDVNVIVVAGSDRAVVVHVPDADALLAGDLVEESAPPVTAKVDAAQAAYERGADEVTTGTLEVLENELVGIDDRHITDSARELLLELLDQLSASL